MSGSNIERRSAPRANADFPLRLSGDVGGQPATLHDISTTGLRCTYGEPIGEMTLMGIQLELPGGSPADAQGVVVRCDKQRGVNPPTYEVAIYFTEMPSQTRRAIEEFVHSQPAER